MLAKPILFDPKAAVKDREKLQARLKAIKNSIVQFIPEKDTRIRIPEHY